MVVKKTNNKELSKLDLSINLEDWKGNKEEVLTINDGKNTIKVSLSRIKQVYGDYLLLN